MKVGMRVSASFWLGVRTLYIGCLPFSRIRILLDPPLRGPPCAVRYAKLGYFVGQVRLQYASCFLAGELMVHAHTGGLLAGGLTSADPKALCSQALPSPGSRHRWERSSNKVCLRRLS